MNTSRQTPVTVDFTTPNWPKLSREVPPGDAIYYGIEYICDELIILSKLEVLDYTPATLRSFAKAIERLRYRSHNSASYDEWWDRPVFYSFHNGAITSLRLIILNEFEERVRSDVSVMMKCLEASVHHEFLCLVEMWEDKKLVKKMGRENYRKTMGSGRMKCKMHFT